MKALDILKDIFLEERDIWVLLSSPKNLTTHYRGELRHIECDEICTWGEYVELEKKIERYKYHSDRSLSRELGEVLAKCVKVSRLYGEYHDWVVVPVAMHWSRYILRGFHHTGYLAKDFGKTHNLLYKPLLSTRYTPRQSKLSRTLRIKNKKNSFSIKNGYTVPSHIILIDDVVSSGSTLHEASAVLKAAGAKVIICFTLASNQ